MRKLEETLRLSTHQQEGIASTTPAPESQPPTLSTPSTGHFSCNSGPSSKRLGNSSDVALNLSCRLGSFPGSSIVALTNEHRTQFGSLPKSQPDLISRGLVSLEDAEEYFTNYRRFMEPCIYQILAEDDCLANVRARSSLLTAALCTVGSFCATPAAHQKCYDSFVEEVSDRLFSGQHSFDDVRALCIVAFWLKKKMSSMLVGLGMFTQVPRRYDINT